MFLVCDVIVEEFVAYYMVDELFEFIEDYLFEYVDDLVVWLVYVFDFDAVVEAVVLLCEVVEDFGYLFLFDISESMQFDWNGDVEFWLRF